MSETQIRRIEVKTFQTRLADGRIFYVAAYTRSDIPTLLEEKGIDRHDILCSRPIQNLLNLPDELEMSEPQLIGSES